ncbi:MAG: hypothetical protein JXR96_25080 [Deltaproteobacteria bacterium]|nr:hypothetical protein [Deltaproteobacteria bacterium]
MARIETSPRALLLTGVPGIGKSTLLRRVADQLGGHSLGGFITDELRGHGGGRVGFALRPFAGPEAVLAHVGIRGPARVGRYGVDLAALDAVVDRALAPGFARYLVDEVGKMECLSQRFVAAMERLLAGAAPLVATVALRGRGFIARIKQLPGVELLQVERDNRERLPAQVLGWLRADGSLPGP